jgi:hypothetical protein
MTTPSKHTNTSTVAYIPLWLNLPLHTNLKWHKLGTNITIEILRTAARPKSTFIVISNISSLYISGSGYISLGDDT